MAMSSRFRELSTLFSSGTIGFLTDAELIVRFTSGNADSAQPAFALLVNRHGAMVLRACREILRDEHEAEDCFQATFLLLARKARNLRVTDSLGPWLHAVACRVAACARSAVARRKRHERAATEKTKRSYVVAESDDWKRVLHDEVSCLPDRFRKPVILCYLEGLTSDQAASSLGWPVGTVRSRLARGRARLHGRLARRGLLPSAGLGTLIAGDSLKASVIEATARAAMRISSGQSLLGAVPAAVVTLVRKGLIEMTRQTLWNIAIKAMLPLGTIIVCLGLATGPLGGAPVVAPAAPEGMTRESIERLAPLLGTWENAQSPDQTFTIKLLRADPALARDLGFDAPYICTWAWDFTFTEPKTRNTKPSRLLFVDPSRTPAQTTYTPLGFTAGDSGSLDGIPGIYRVQGDTLTILSPRRLGAPRPSSFDQIGDTESMNLETYRRVKKAAVGEKAPEAKAPTGTR